ncbi:MAG: translation elongation factor Ts [Oscillospiraceae bacterium]|jgi:elongation factor Ts|nr:translation elongation factor Ts [Oscillospiraceae bacterium]
MAFTATDVKNLREMTGVGMMDCKKALEASDGDTDKAIDWLREKGLAAAQKKAGRITAEGMAYAAVFDGVGVAVEVNAETDFVGKNEKFVEFVKNIAGVIAASAPKDVEALFELPYPGLPKTVREQQQEMVLVIGENITVRRFARYPDGFSAPYVHAGGRFGVIANFAVEGIDLASPRLAEAGKDVAMQIASMNPKYVSPDDLSPSEVAKEREIQLGLATEENKTSKKPASDEIVLKKVDGRMNKYYAEVCLLNQEFVKGDKQTVAQYIAAVAKELGGKITVSAFTRYEKGEGIEKKEENFAEEIAKLVQ